MGSQLLFVLTSDTLSLIGSLIKLSLRALSKLFARIKASPGLSASSKAIELSLDPVYHIKRDATLTFAWDLCFEIFEKAFGNPQEVGLLLNLASLHGLHEFFDALSSIEEEGCNEIFLPLVINGLDIIKAALTFGNKKSVLPL